MKLLICLVTYNRLDYTKRTLRGFFKTIELPYYLIVVDNNSTDGTKEYLMSLEGRNRINRVIFNPENYYPGRACNIGWANGLEDYPQATHLMRLDNDMHLERGWDLTAKEYFDKIDRLGQLGIEHDAIKGHEDKAEKHNGKLINPWPGVVGGPNIIKKSIFTSGLKYDETPWETDDVNTPAMQEDSKFSRLIQSYGFLTGHMVERLAWTFANETNWSDYPEYYKKTFT
jgi:glycosyltransferase involved in cell wall biosynthesis